MLQCVKHQPVASTGLQTQPPLQRQLQNYQCRKYSSTVQNLPSSVTYEEVVKALEDSSAIVIDVRQPEELVRDGAIPGALHIPLGDLETALSFRPKKFEKIFKVSIDQSTPLVFTCLAGIRSRKAQGLAKMMGYTNTGNYVGGWMEWAEKSQK